MHLNEIESYFKQTTKYYYMTYMSSFIYLFEVVITKLVGSKRFEKRLRERKKIFHFFFSYQFDSRCGKYDRQW